MFGIDTAHHVQRVMAEGFPTRMQKDYRNAIDIDIDMLFDAGLYGKKNGKGFYRWET